MNSAADSPLTTRDKSSRGVCLLYGLCAPFCLGEADCCGFTEPTGCKALPSRVAVGMLVGRIGPPAVLAARPNGMWLPQVCLWVGQAPGANWPWERFQDGAHLSHCQQGRMISQKWLPPASQSPGEVPAPSSLSRSLSKSLSESDSGTFQTVASQLNVGFRWEPPHFSRRISVIEISFLLMVTCLGVWVLTRQHLHPSYSSGCGSLFISLVVENLFCYTSGHSQKGLICK